MVTPATPGGVRTQPAESGVQLHPGRHHHQHRGPRGTPHAKLSRIFKVNFCGFSHRSRFNFHLKRVKEVKLLKP